MSGFVYLLFSDGGDLARLGSLEPNDLRAGGLGPGLLAEEVGGRLEIWRGEELVAVVGAPTPTHDWGV